MPADVSMSYAAHKALCQKGRNPGLLCHQNMRLCLEKQESVCLRSRKLLLHSGRGRHLGYLTLTSNRTIKQLRRKVTHQLVKSFTFCISKRKVAQTLTKLSIAAPQLLTRNCTSSLTTNKYNSHKKKD